MKSRTTHWLLSALLCTSGWLASSAHADQIYISLTGQQTGAFPGESPRAPNRIEALKLQQLVSTPESAHGHALTGRPVPRQYGPFKFTKLAGAASVQLYQSMISGERLSIVQIDFVGMTSDGESRVLQNIKLTNARVVGIERYAEADAKGNTRTLEDISIAFGRIEVNDVVTGRAVADEIAAVR